MRKLCAALMLMAGAAQADGLPSGQPLALWQISWERMDSGPGLQLVIRAIAPELGAQGFDAAQTDMDWLCTTHGLAVTGLPYGAAGQVVVNLMDRPIARGRSDPSVAQFFSVYRVEANACILEDL